MTRSFPNRTPRGSTLVLAMVLLAVLSLVGVAAVTLSQQERVNVGAKAKRDLQVACANAARMVVYAEMAKFGSAGLKSTDPLPEVTLPDGTKLSQQHYDTPAGMTVVDVTPQRSVNVSSNRSGISTGDLTNTFVSLAKTESQRPAFQAVARCEDAKGRMLEVEFFVAFAL